MSAARSRARLTAAGFVGLVALVGLVVLASGRGGHGAKVAVRDETSSSSTRASAPVDGAVSSATTTTDSTATTLGSAKSTDDIAPTTATSAPDEVTSDTAPATTVLAPGYGPNALLELVYDPAVYRYHVDAVDPDGSGRTTLTSGIDSWWVDWAPGHRQFAWASVRIFEDGRHLTIVNADGSGTRDLVQHPVGGDFYPFFPAAWSPDGSTIAEFCQSQNDWQVRDICGVDVATGDLHDWVREYGLIDPEDRNEWGEAPTFAFGGWDPSGTRVSYVVTSEDSHGSRSHLDVLDLQTRAHTAIVDAVDGGVFTADGQSLLYRTSSSSPLYRTSLDGGSPAVVPGVTVTPIERSPDGEWYMGAEDLHWQLFNLDGEVRQVTDADGLIRISW